MLVGVVVRRVIKLKPAKRPSIWTSRFTRAADAFKRPGFGSARLIVKTKLLLSLRPHAALYGTPTRLDPTQPFTALPLA